MARACRQCSFFPCCPQGACPHPAPLHAAGGSCLGRACSGQLQSSLAKSAPCATRPEAFGVGLAGHAQGRELSGSVKALPAPLGAEEQLGANGAIVGAVLRHTELSVCGFHRLGPGGTDGASWWLPSCTSQVPAPLCSPLCAVHHELGSHSLLLGVDLCDRTDQRSSGASHCSTRLLWGPLSRVVSELLYFLAFPLLGCADAAWGREGAALQPQLVCRCRRVRAPRH